MQTHVSRADVVIRNPAGDPLAIVEVKNREGLTADVAAQLRRNMASHGLIGRAPYFLVLSQDVGYLWQEESKGDSSREPPRTAGTAAPAAQFPMGGVVERYARGPVGARRLRELELEPLLIQWLNELSAGVLATVSSDQEPERSLAETGLLEALRGATIELEAQA